jgi:hypothetical protein
MDDPVELTVERTDCGRATLVAATLSNRGRTPRRVRLVADGPVWPPRRAGVPVAWADGRERTAETVELAVEVDARARRALGYATPGEATGPTVRDSERAATDGGTTADGIDPTPAGVVRCLGDSRPPADAVPDGSAGSDAAAPSTRSADGSPDGSRPPGAASLPPAVRAWLATVDRRLREQRGDAADRARLRRLADRAERVARR